MNELEKYRDEITGIDGKMAELFEKRMSAVRKVADYKKERGLPVLDAGREAQIIEKNLAGISDAELKNYYVSFLRNTIELSKKYQAQLINSKNSAVIPVHSDQRDYNIYLGNGLLSRAAELFNLDRKVLVVTDSGVPSDYSATIASLCGQPVTVCIEQGEKSKNFDSFRLLLSTMLENGFTRTDCVAAVGGGVVGDLSAFAAACYMRGVDFYNIPTTLLSQVDSSIGGKAAIDFEGVKNIVGAFKQPDGVLIDPDTLKTLDERQKNAGFAEAIKMAVTSDEQLLELIENTDDFERDLSEIIRRALMIKKDVVEKDPTEQNLRKVLNFGHTIGHAIESASKGELLHGECVALGMLPMCSDALRPRVKAVLKKYSLPCEITQTADELVPFIMHDKKKSSSYITAVLSDEAGTFRFEKMTVDKIKSLLEKAI